MIPEKEGTKTVKSCVLCGPQDLIVEAMTFLRLRF